MENANINLSIIIPTYNNGKLVAKAIQSASTYGGTDLEILVVDDGSTDGSTNELQNIDPRVQVIHKKNGGVSSARNLGLQKAQGEYILFLDADDQLTPEWGQQMEHLKGQDLILFNYQTSKGEIRNINRQCLLSGDELEEYRCTMISNPTKNLTVWGKFLRRQVIEEHGLHFDENLSFAEDGDFMVAFLLEIQSLQLVPASFYRYLDSPSSVMRTFDGKKVAGYLDALSMTTKRFEHQREDIQMAGAYYVLMHVNVMMVREVFDINNPVSNRQKTQQLKRIIKEPVISSALAKVPLRACRKPRLVPIALLKLRLHCLVRMIFTLRSKENHK